MHGSSFLAANASFRPRGFLPSRRCPPIARVVVLLGALFVLGACPPSPAPSELRPLFERMEGLPGMADPADCGSDPDCCLAARTCRDVETSVRNIGGRDVALGALSFAAVDGQDAALADFTDLVSDVKTNEVIPPDGQAILRFRYRTPGGHARAVKLVVESDAEVNPRLEIEVHTTAYVPPPPPPPPQEDAGPIDDAGAGEADAGEADAGEADAGDADAGAGDAGAEDAGVVDGG